MHCSVSGAVRVVSEPALCFCFSFPVTQHFNGKVMSILMTDRARRPKGSQRGSVYVSPSLECKLLEDRGVEFIFVFPIAPSMVFFQEKS